MSESHFERVLPELRRSDMASTPNWFKQLSGPGAKVILDIRDSLEDKLAPSNNNMFRVDRYKHFMLPVRCDYSKPAVGSPPSDPYNMPPCICRFKRGVTTRLSAHTDPMVVISKLVYGVLILINFAVCRRLSLREWSLDFISDPGGSTTLY